jgi:polar amino acid transport system substrate-binding protein
MRTSKALVAAAVVASGLAVAMSAGASSNARGVAPSSLPSLSACKTQVKSLTLHSGELTVATDNPVYPPWFESNNPSNGRGYESAVAYAVASLLGFSHHQVVWAYEPFSSSYAPGPKNFDFDINEISWTAQRAKVVTFSIGYYNVTQSIVTIKGDAIIHKHTPSELRSYEYGDQKGTTGLAYIYKYIKPTKQPLVFPTLDIAVQRLQDNGYDALVVDTPDGQYMATEQLKHGVQLGQFPTTGEHYSLLFQKGNQLVGCVNSAIKHLTQDGQLAALQKKWLGIYTNIPKLKP